MTTFKIHTNNSITAPATSQHIGESGSETFRNAQELTILAEKWPAARLVEIWNGLPGVRPVKRFTSRPVAMRRIWQAVQHLAPGGSLAKSSVLPKNQTIAKKTTRPPRKEGGGNSKTDRVIELLER